METTKLCFSYLLPQRAELTGVPSCCLPVTPCTRWFTLSKGFSPLVNRDSCGPNADTSCDTWGSSNCSLHLFLPRSLPSLLPLMIESLNAPSDAIFQAFWKIWRVVWDKHSGIHWLFLMLNWCLLRYINSYNIHNQTLSRFLNNFLKVSKGPASKKFENTGLQIS